MPVILPNVTISTSRGAFNATTGVTSPVGSVPVLSGKRAHIGAIAAMTPKWLPASVVESSKFEMKVDPGTDIVREDVVTAILLLDGVTPWPGLNVHPGQTPTITYWVTFVYEGTAGPLAARYVYVAEFTAGGPVAR